MVFESPDCIQQVPNSGRGIAIRGKGFPNSGRRIPDGDVNNHGADKNFAPRNGITPFGNIIITGEKMVFSPEIETIPVANNKFLGAI